MKIFEDFCEERKFKKELSNNRSTVSHMDYRIYVIIKDWLAKAKKDSNIKNSIEQFIRILVGIGITGKLSFYYLTEQKKIQVIGRGYNSCIIELFNQTWNLLDSVVYNYKDAVINMTIDRKTSRYVYLPEEDVCILENIDRREPFKFLNSHYNDSFINYTMRLPNSIIDVKLYVLRKKHTKQRIQDTDDIIENYLFNTNEFTNIHKIQDRIINVYKQENNYYLQELKIRIYEIKKSENNSSTSLVLKSKVQYNRKK